MIVEFSHLSGGLPTRTKLLAADATAWMSPEISSVADAVWVIGKGDSYDPFTARSCLAELQSRNYSEIKIRKCCSSDRVYL